MTREELWKGIFNFYKELVSKYKWKQEAMIELVQLFKELRLWDRYFPSTSHESLGLSTVSSYEERLVKPMVYITYKSDTETFVVTYQTGQGNTLKEEDCGKLLDAVTIDKIENWLLPANSLS